MKKAPAASWRSKRAEFRNGHLRKLTAIVRTLVLEKVEHRLQALLVPAFGASRGGDTRDHRCCPHRGPGRRLGGRASGRSHLPDSKRRARHVRGTRRLPMSSAGACPARGLRPPGRCWRDGIADTMGTRAARPLEVPKSRSQRELRTLSPQTTGELRRTSCDPVHRGRSSERRDRSARAYAACMHRRAALVNGRTRRGAQAR
jgi:hypothetical protein